LRVNNIIFNIRVTGKGPLFLWGHGLMANMESEDKFGLFKWDQFPKEYQLVRYDARGHGGTSASLSPDDYLWSNLAQDMLAIGCELSEGPFIAGGQSMGCATAIMAAIQAKDRVKGLVLVNPPTIWGERSRQAAVYRKIARIGGFLGGRILSRLARKGATKNLPPCLMDAPPENITGLTEGLRNIKRKTFSSLFRGMALSDLPAADQIGTIDVPVLLLAWKGDPVHPEKVAIELNRLLPRSKLLIAETYADITKWHHEIKEFVAKVDAAA
jgi:pimeloyl-ACP methyl ester carboxylesterase